MKHESNPEISVILPFYNAEKTLRSAVESIIKQTFTDFEILLIDNNSTDSSPEIANELVRCDSRINTLKETKQGVAFAMNCGLENAKGKYLARMDADDMAHPRRLAQQVEFLIQNPEIGFIGTEVKYVPHNANTEGFQRFVDWVNSFHSSREIELNRFVEIPIVNPSILFRRELFEQFGGCQSGDFPEDYEMQLRYLEAGVKMAKLPSPLLEWHDYSTRLTRTDDRYSSDAFFKTKAAYFKTWSEKNNPFHPRIWIWGAGRKTRQRSIFLEEQGLLVEGRIDVVKGKAGSVYYEDIPEPGKNFIVSMVTNTGAGEQIRTFLITRNYTEGEDFILMG